MKQFLQWSSIFSTLAIMGFVCMLGITIAAHYTLGDVEGHYQFAAYLFGFSSLVLFVIDLTLRAFIRSHKALNLVELGLTTVVAGWLL